MGVRYTIYILWLPEGCTITCKAMLMFWMLRAMGRFQWIRAWKKGGIRWQLEQVQGEGWPHVLGSFYMNSAWADEVEVYKSIIAPWIYTGKSILICDSGFLTGLPSIFLMPMPDAGMMQLSTCSKLGKVPRLGKENVGHEGKEGGNQITHVYLFPDWAVWLEEDLVLFEMADPPICHPV